MIGILVVDSPPDHAASFDLGKCDRSICAATTLWRKKTIIRLPDKLIGVMQPSSRGLPRHRSIPMTLKNICLFATLAVVAMPAFAAEAGKKPIAADESKKPAAVDVGKKPLTNWTCDDFLAFDDVVKPKVVYAATPHMKRRKHKDIIEIDETEKVIPIVITECQKVRQNVFLRELEGAWDKVKADTKAIEKKI
jgi:acid stress chaperone HdeA